MSNHSEGDYKLRILRLSTFAIASVVIVEVVLGLAISSLAILSDGLHALLDVVTSVMLFLATKEALKPPDEKHTYGHEKFEPIGGLIAGIVLLGVGALVIYEAVFKLIQGEGVNQELGFAGFIKTALYLINLEIFGECCLISVKYSTITFETQYECYTNTQFIQH